MASRDHEQTNEAGPEPRLSRREVYEDVAAGREGQLRGTGARAPCLEGERAAARRTGAVSENATSLP